ncbi:glycosyl transferase family 1 [Rhodovarius sp.]|uniref:glycosyl transferase family 1 n=1 Tax=Rhodovarius sp. TaxID=2972673 RepID=UPI003340F9B3
MSQGLRLAYLVHDLHDPAVARRLDMMRPHLADAVVIGFHRSGEAPASISGWPAVALGRTADARFARRVVLLLRARLLLAALKPHIARRDVVLSRQLETLLLGRAARDGFAPGAVLAQECLDVHRLLVGQGLAARLLRWLEHRLLAACDLVITSSPGFEREYLRPMHGAALPPVLLVENKVLAGEAGAGPALRPVGPPWRIGWYGVLRCRRSLLLLAALARRLPGLVEVDLRGRPARSAIPDFDALVAASPGLVFGGGYDRRHELAGLYGGVHYVWAIDFFEAGANSAWLLPNRLYEGTLYGAVPIAQGDVETGRWLALRRAGLLLEGDQDRLLLERLAAHFGGLTAAGFADAAAAVAAIPRSALVDDGRDGQRLAKAFRSLLAGLPGEAMVQDGCNL